MAVARSYSRGFLLYAVGVAHNAVMIDPEKSLFESFTLPRRKRRYLELLGTKGGRDKIRSSLDHFKDLNPRYARPVRPQESNPERIFSLLRSLGAPDSCHLMSSSPELDNREMPLLEALQRIVGYGQGTFVCCVPGRLAYFESEEVGRAYLCLRKCD
jgi:hypothetical protein